ncbi:MAG: rhomboid family intramembrane serine protease [Anaerolineae bacterium]|nr:rhomboid family intramembrane serine protease [Anaerolineales bacterium]MCQ3980673.1 rhomboid family intramembrane serine protease [Anaerolineae bacterium]
MLPLKDMNPTRRFPFLTYTLIVINVLVFLWELSLSPSELETALTSLSVVPARVSADPFSLDSILSVIRSMFFHAGWTHLLGNMLYLYLFGDNVEDRLGEIVYFVLYFGSGFAATVAQIAIDPTSTIVQVGASGAIAGVLGSYLILFPGVRVKGIMPLRFVSFWVEWPAWLVLGLWFLAQLFNGTASLGAETSDGGVAFFAHIGGFVFGLILTQMVIHFYPQPPASERREILYQRARRNPAF